MAPELQHSTKHIANDGTSQMAHFSREREREINLIFLKGLKQRIYIYVCVQDEDENNIDLPCISLAIFGDEKSITMR
jgi:hypothetical protein